MEHSKRKLYLTLAAKMLVFISMMIIGMSLLHVIISMLLPSLVDPFHENNLMGAFVTQTCAFFGVVVATFVLFRYWDHIPLSRLGFPVKACGKELLWGLLVAVMIYAVGFMGLWGIGSIEVTGVHLNWSSLCFSWLLMLLVSLTEEIMMRGVVLGRMLDAGINRYMALFLSSFLFSLIHIFNPNFSFLPFLNIFLAGMLLGASYIYTRSLWFPISLHLFWNWIQGPILGWEVSGQTFTGNLLTLYLPEKNSLNGADFGFEGSIVCTILMVISILIVLKVASKQSAYDQGRY